MRYLFNLIWMFLISVTAHSVFAAPSLPLPDLTTPVMSSIESVDQAIEAMYISDATVKDSDLPAELKQKVRFTTDLAQIEIQAIEELISDNSVPNSEKEIRLARYTTGDERMADIIIRAFKAGIKVHVITDFNPIMEYPFSEDQKSTSDFSKATLKKPEHNEGAQFVKDLLEAGLKINENIFSQPIFNEALMEMIPIMHEKALLLKAGTKTRTIFSSANLARNLRYNRLFVSRDPEIFSGYLDHLNELTKTYVAGGKTKDIPEMPRKLIQYKDGSTFEMAFTDGKFNPNDRIVEMLNDPNLKLVSGTFSQFVMTNGKVMEALESALEKSPTAKVLMVGDDRFAANNGWGLLPIVEGITVYRPEGHEVKGFKGAQQKQIESYVYQRGAVDPETGVQRLEISEDGPPTARHVWHDKTTSLVFENLEGKKIEVVFSGSFNLSNNSANSEFQAKMVLGDNSWIRKGIDFSVSEVIKRSPEFAIPTVVATTRNVLGLLFGLTDLEVPIDLAKELHKAAVDRDLPKLNDLFERIALIKTTLESPTPRPLVVKRIQEIQELISWYFDSVKPAPNRGIAELRFKQFLGLTLVIADQNLTPYQKKAALRMLIWNPDESLPEVLEDKLIGEGLGYLNAHQNPLNRCVSALNNK